MLSFLVCLNKPTVTGMLCCSGKQYQDWTADYRLYSQNRVDEQECFNVVSNEVQSYLKPDEPFVVAMDDSLFRKTGKHIHGVKYLKDPLGPPFNVNLVLGQRMLQLAGAVQTKPGIARMIPIDFQQAPMPKKPKPNAPKELWDLYKQLDKKANINMLANRRIDALRQQLNHSKHPDRELIMCVDGRFTNGTVLKALPENTTLIGRTRKDAKFSYPPGEQPATGRKRSYGNEAPTPEQIRQDTNIPYKKVKAFAAGKWHHFKLKIVKPLKWRKAGKHMQVQLMVIAPLGYRLRKRSKMLYRKPAYLICTDVNLSPEKLLQYYIWRWDIEVNFRDQKSLLGIGKAQVRNELSTQTLPAIQVATYSIALLAAMKTYGKNGSIDSIPLPKWRQKNLPQRMTTSSIINQLRLELWAGAIQKQSFYHFRNQKQNDVNSQKLEPSIHDALFYAAA